MLFSFSIIFFTLFSLYVAEIAMPQRCASPYVTPAGSILFYFTILFFRLSRQIRVSIRKQR